MKTVPLRKQKVTLPYPNPAYLKGSFSLSSCEMKQKLSITRDFNKSLIPVDLPPLHFNDLIEERKSYTKSHQAVQTFQANLAPVSLFSRSLLVGTIRWSFQIPPSLPNISKSNYQPTSDSISIQPSHSKFFCRSVFFFINLLVRPTQPLLDLIVSNHYSDATFTYNVFPNSNLIKVEAFRRLTRQKTLYDSRVTLFNTYIASDLNAFSLCRSVSQQALDLTPPLIRSNQ